MKKKRKPTVKPKRGSDPKPPFPIYMLLCRAITNYRIAKGEQWERETWAIQEAWGWMVQRAEGWATHAEGKPPEFVAPFNLKDFLLLHGSAVFWDGRSSLTKMVRRNTRSLAVRILGGGRKSRRRK